MKNILSALACCSSLIATGALAGEASYHWGGAYAGGNLGVIWTESHLSASGPNFIPPSDPYSQNLDSTDVNPGFQFGYLHMLDQHWVVGAEADFTYPATQSTFKQVNETGSSYDQFTVKNSLQGSLRLRSGYAIDRFLPFVTAGVSWASMGLDYNNEENNAYSVRTTQTGWMLGGGIEYGLLDNLSARLEYLYTDYGTALNLNPTNIEGITDTSTTTRANMSTNALRAAVNYRF